MLDFITIAFTYIVSCIPFIFGLAALCLAVYIIAGGLISFIRDLWHGLFILWDILLLLAKLVLAGAFLLAGFVWTGLIL